MAAQRNPLYEEIADLVTGPNTPALRTAARQLAGAASPPHWRRTPGTPHEYGARGRSVARRASYPITDRVPACSIRCDWASPQVARTRCTDRQQRASSRRSYARARAAALSAKSVATLILPDGEVREVAGRFADRLIAALANCAPTAMPPSWRWVAAWSATCRLRGGLLDAGRGLHPVAHHPARDGGFLGRRQDRGRPAAGQESGRCLPPAAAVIADIATLATLPNANCAPDWPRW
jgi:hypothetical protein